jgi:uncharacterized protein
MKGGPSNPTDMLKGLGRGKSQSHQGPAHQGPAHQGPPRTPRLLGDLDMRIAADGTWFYQGTPINRMPLVKLFASVLRRESGGGYWLVTPAERGRIQVEDAPFTAVEVIAEGHGPGQRLIFRTNLDEIVALDEAHPLTSRGSAEAPRPYLLVRDRLEARILRSVYYHLVELGEQQGDQFGVWSSGRFFPLGSVEGSVGSTL